MVDELTGRGRVERVYREQGPRMVRTLFAYARDMEIAEDAVAEAFAQVIRRGDEVRDVAAWVWRSSFRIANGELAKRRSRSSAQAREGRYEMGENAAEVFDAVGTLSPKQRAAILLHHYVAFRSVTWRTRSARLPRPSACTSAWTTTAPCAAGG
jgi:DNA-directed RNA polymerase specialized sigma24 family protein